MVSVSVFKNTLFFYPLMFIVLNYATLIQVTQLLAVSFTEIQCYFSFSEFTLHLSNRDRLMLLDLLDSYQSKASKLLTRCIFVSSR